MSHVLAAGTGFPRRKRHRRFGVLRVGGWAHRVAARRPLKDEASLLAASDEIWLSLETPDWMEAFSKHPGLGSGRRHPGLGTIGGLVGGRTAHGGLCFRFRSARTRGRESRIRAAVPAAVHRVRKREIRARTSGNSAAAPAK